MKIRFAVAPTSGSLLGPEILAFADALEASGFDGAWLSDLPVAPALDPLLGLALIAGRTSRLKLGANVVPLGRNPFLLAKSLAQLDQLSGGRLLLSFVAGLDSPGEREALGLRDAKRGAALEESLALLRAWWAGEAVDHQSERWSFTGLRAPVTPVQEPLEVWMGGRAQPALERAGRLADGWLGAMVTPQEAGAAREQIQGAAERAGREIDPEHFGLSIAYAHSAPPADLVATMRARRSDVDPLALVPTGAPALRALIEGHIEAGLSKFVVRPAEEVARWEDEVEWLAAAILDLQS